MKRAFPFAIATLAVSSTVAMSARANTLQVGPAMTYTTPCAAIAAAQPNDTIEIAPGTYTDTCDISVAGLTLKGVGGQPKIDLSATNHPDQYKGVYVVDADNVTIDNLEITGAHVDDDKGSNGAALRVTGHSDVVRNCYLHDNQNGILAVPIVDGGTFTVEHTELSHNGMGDGCANGGCTHNLYAGSNGPTRYDKLVFQYNWSHDISSDTISDHGHLLKSRARESDVLYNRITGEDGHESYGIDLPNGGLAIVVGNVVQKGPMADNKTLLFYGEEGIDNADKRLFVVNNTFVNDFGSGTFIDVEGGATLTAHNNLFVGMGTISTTGALSADNLSSATPLFVAPATYDYHLMAGSPAIDQGVDPGSADAFSLTPTDEYVQPLMNVARKSDGKLDLGAFEYGTDTNAGGAGSTGATGAANGTSNGATSGAGGPGATGSGSGGGDAGDGSSSGCSCSITDDESGKAPAMLSLAALALAWNRFQNRRKRGV